MGGHQFIRTEDSELHALDGAQRACAAPGAGATPHAWRTQARCAGANLSTKSLRRLHLGAQTPSGRPPGRTSPSWEEKAGGGKGGGGKEAGKRKGVKGALLRLSGDFFRLPKRKKRGRERKRFQGKKKKKGNE